MTRLLGSLTAALLSLSIAACGSTGSTRSHSSSHTIKRDRDDDADNNNDDNHVLYYGRAPNAAERQELVKVITSYYIAASTENGAAACRLLIPFIAESVVETLSRDPGLGGRTCGTVMAKLFKQYHAVLKGESATLKFYSVRVSGIHGLTVLSFSTLPEVRQLLERRDSNGSWKIQSLLDGILE